MAVVVPSPATSLVLLATSLTILAPMSSYLSSSSISLATVTPSLVTVGEPKVFWMMTLRPLGPSVTLTARASLATPAPHRLAGFLIERNHLGSHLFSLVVSSEPEA